MTDEEEDYQLVRFAAIAAANLEKVRSNRLSRSDQRAKLWCDVYLLKSHHQSPQEAADLAVIEFNKRFS